MPITPEPRRTGNWIAGPEENAWSYHARGQSDSIMPSGFTPAHLLTCPQGMAVMPTVLV